MSNTKALQRLFTSYGNAMYRNDPDAAEKIARMFSEALAQPAASGGPVATVRRAHAGGRVRSISYQVCDLLPGANVQDGALLYATAQPAPAQPGPVAGIDYAALMKAAEARKYRPGTGPCVAFKNGAEWQAAQPAPALVPLTEEQVVMDAIMMMPAKISSDCAKACEYGIRYAERHHGITPAKEAPHAAPDAPADQSHPQR